MRWDKIRIILRFIVTFAGLVVFFQCAAAGADSATVTHALGVSLDGSKTDPIKSSDGKVIVLIFVRPDCPISNRYAPAIERMSHEHAAATKFWLIYPDASLTSEAIDAHRKEYGYSLPALRDPLHALVKEAEVKVTPEAAIFSPSGALLYHGRLDNWYQDFGRSRPAATTHDLTDALEAAEHGAHPKKSYVPAVGCYIADLE